MTAEASQPAGAVAARSKKAAQVVARRAQVAVARRVGAVVARKVPEVESTQLGEVESTQLGEVESTQLGEVESTQVGEVGSRSLSVGLWTFQARAQHPGPGLMRDRKAVAVLVAPRKRNETQAGAVRSGASRGAATLAAAGAEATVRADRQRAAVGWTGTPEAGWTGVPLAGGSSAWVAERTVAGADALVLERWAPGGAASWSQVRLPRTSAARAGGRSLRPGARHWRPTRVRPACLRVAGTGQRASWSPPPAERRRANARGRASRASSSSRSTRRGTDR